MSSTTQISITPERKSTRMRKVKRWLHTRAFMVTFRTMLRVPVTDIYHPVHRSHSHYPAVNHRYRGLLALSQDACTGCKKCERICPTNCIIMEVREVKGAEHRFPGYFSGRCMMCGLCEESCDRQWAIRHTDQFEDAAYTRDQLYYGPERMFEMWENHIETRIQAGIAHKAVPDKKRATRESLHAWPPQRSPTPEVISKEERERKKQEEEEKKKIREAAKVKREAVAAKKSVKKATKKPADTEE